MCASFFFFFFLFLTNISLFSPDIGSFQIPQLTYRQLRCISSYLDLKTASSIVHSKLDYCNSLYYNLPDLN